MGARPTENRLHFSWPRFMETRMTPKPRPGILDISPYVGGRAGVPGMAKVWKLSSNESPLGPSPKALAALDEAKASVSLYPEGSARQLREALGEVFGLNPDRIVTLRRWLRHAAHHAGERLCAAGR